jgi:hypothetical protein
MQRSKEIAFDAVQFCSKARQYNDALRKNDPISGALSPPQARTAHPLARLEDDAVPRD